MTLNKNHSGNYDHVRCPVCARPWDSWHDPGTGKGEGVHPQDTICNRHRPIAPSWVAAALERHERAREAVATASNGAIALVATTDA